jgi:hypothetical protein
VDCTGALTANVLTGVSGVVSNAALTQSNAASTNSIAGTTYFGRPVISTATNGTGFQQVLYTPASSSAACVQGQFWDDASYHYVCTATNTIKRVALSVF